MIQFDPIWSKSYQKRCKLPPFLTKGWQPSTKHLLGLREHCSQSKKKMWSRWSHVIPCNNLTSLFCFDFRAEIINDLSTMVKDHLMMFYKSTGGYKPHRVIMYRDGVSEGQFTQVCLFEIIIFFFQILYLLHIRAKLFLHEHSYSQSFPRRLLNVVSKFLLLLTCISQN